MKPRKVRLTGKMHQIPPEELRQVVGGKGGTPWESQLPPGAAHAIENASEHALLNSNWANWSKGIINPPGENPG